MSRSNPDVALWELEFSFRNRENANRFIRKLLKEPYVLETWFSRYYDENEEKDRYLVNVEGRCGDALVKISKMVSKIENKDRMNDH